MPFAPASYRPLSGVTRHNKRPSPSKRLYDAWWNRERKRFLKDNPLCVHHKDKGEYVQATEVDHIKPHEGNIELFRDKNNWQGLCKSCHSKKTAREQRRKWY